MNHVAPNAASIFFSMDGETFEQEEKGDSIEDYYQFNMILDVFNVESKLFGSTD